MTMTAASLVSALKEQWTDDDLNKQWFADDNPLSRFEQVEGTMIGKQAQVPIWGDIVSGGYTSAGSSGPNVINTPNDVNPLQATYTLVQHFQPISVDISAINQAKGDNKLSVVGGLDLAFENAVKSLRVQATRQLVTNGDGIVAQCGTSGGSNVVLPLVASPSGSAYGYDAIRRRWLRPGATVDVGTTADTDSLGTALTVSAVSPVPTAPTITLSSAVNATAGTHFVYIANPNSATLANTELNGLRNMVNTTGALGGLNPATAGQEFWASPVRDTSTSVLSLDLALSLATEVQQETGEPHTDVWSGLKQRKNWYSLLQNQVRFSGDRALGAGGVESVTWNGMKWTGWNAILDSDLFFLNLKDFVRVTGAITKPTWYSELMGVNKGMTWPGTSSGFVDQIFYAFQIGMRRRNGSAAATALTV